MNIKILLRKPSVILGLWIVVVVGLHLHFRSTRQINSSPSASGPKTESKVVVQELQFRPDLNIPDFEASAEVSETYAPTEVLLSPAPTKDYSNVTEKCRHCTKAFKTLKRDDMGIKDFEWLPLVQIGGPLLIPGGGRDAMGVIEAANMSDFGHWRRLFASVAGPGEDNAEFGHLFYDFQLQIQRANPNNPQRPHVDPYWGWKAATMVFGDNYTDFLKPDRNWYTHWTCSPKLSTSWELLLGRIGFATGIPRLRRQRMVNAWFFMGHAPSLQVSGYPAHMDRMQPEVSATCHVQVSGSKLWQMGPPTDCVGSCDKFMKYQSRPGDIFCLNPMRWTHRTFIPVQPNEDLSISVAFDLEVNNLEE